jgi:pimeloyl-ACP methyl ester carboxylesterase
MSRSGALEKPTVAEKTRIVTPARIVALALITLLVAGLAYLRFVPGSGSVSVPEGAKPGDLILQPCDYATENGSYAADCGTLVVPENRADEQSRLIALPVTRIPARSNHSREPIFILQGGPGHSNMTFDKVSRYADERDVVLVGYRGVDGSARLDCPEVESALSHSTDLASEKTSQAYADAYRACADRLTADGLDLGSYGIAQQVDDMEAARTALGYDRIDLLSESAGTRTAIIYSWRYPDSIHRSVMVGVNPRAISSFIRAPRMSRSIATPPSAQKMTAAVPAPLISPPRSGRRTPRSPTAGCSCRSRRAMCASPRSSD